MSTRPTAPNPGLHVEEQRWLRGWFLSGPFFQNITAITSETLALSSFNKLSFTNICPVCHTVCIISSGCVSYSCWGCVYTAFYLNQSQFQQHFLYSNDKSQFSQLFWSSPLLKLVPCCISHLFLGVYGFGKQMQNTYLIYGCHGCIVWSRFGSSNTALFTRHGGQTIIETLSYNQAENKQYSTCFLPVRSSTLTMVQFTS